jgi:alcohol dehydrogenase class IV
MSKLSEQAINDLAGHAVRRCEHYLRDALQFVDDHDQKMVIATQVAAFGFGLAARFVQHGYHERLGYTPDFAECADAVVGRVLRLAKQNPPPAVGGMEE